MRFNDFNDGRSACQLRRLAPPASRLAQAPPASRLALSLAVSEECTRHAHSAMLFDPAVAINTPSGDVSCPTYPCTHPPCSSWGGRGGVVAL